jgi:hypothetical protein
MPHSRISQLIQIRSIGASDTSRQDNPATHGNWVSPGLFIGRSSAVWAGLQPFLQRSGLPKSDLPAREPKSYWVGLRPSIRSAARCRLTQKASCGRSWAPISRCSCCQVFCVSWHRCWSCLSVAREARPRRLLRKHSPDSSFRERLGHRKSARSGAKPCWRRSVVGATPDSRPRIRKASHAGARPAGLTIRLLGLARV